MTTAAATAAWKDNGIEKLVCSGIALTHPTDGRADYGRQIMTTSPHRRAGSPVWIVNLLGCEKNLFLLHGTGDRSDCQDVDAGRRPGWAGQFQRSSWNTLLLVLRNSQLRQPRNSDSWAVDNRCVARHGDAQLRQDEIVPK